MRKILTWIIGAALVLGGGFFVLNTYIYQEKQGDGTTEGALETQRIADPDRSATYGCADGKSIYAGFSEGIVALALSDGREITLEEVAEGSYANETGISFSTESGRASVEENGRPTYVDCISQ